MAQKKPRPPQAALDRVRTGKCLLCDSGHVKRGLCDAHYQRHLDTKRKQGHGRVWIRLLIAEGLILPAQAIREVTNPNPFDTASGGLSSPEPPAGGPDVS